MKLVGGVINIYSITLGTYLYRPWQGLYLFIIYSNWLFYIQQQNIKLSNNRLLLNTDTHSYTITNTYTWIHIYLSIIYVHLYRQSSTLGGRGGGGWPQTFTVSLYGGVHPSKIEYRKTTMGGAEEDIKIKYFHRSWPWATPSMRIEI